MHGGQSAVHSWCCQLIVRRVINTNLSRNFVIVMKWHWVVLETPFAGAFVSDIYIYKWECSCNVNKSFCLFPCAQIILLRHNFGYVWGMGVRWCAKWCEQNAIVSAAIYQTWPEWHITWRMSIPESGAGKRAVRCDHLSPHIRHPICCSYQSNYQSGIFFPVPEIYSIWWF